MADVTPHVPAGPPSETAGKPTPDSAATAPDSEPSIVFSPNQPVNLGPSGAAIEVLGHGSSTSNAIADAEVTVAPVVASVAVMEVAYDREAPTWSFGTPLEIPAADMSPSSSARHQSELPFAPAAAAPPAAPRQPLFGPIGRPTAAPVVPLLAVITLGGYALAWHHRLNREIEQFDPKLHARPGRSLLAVMVPWLIGLLTTVAGAAVIVTARLGVHLPFETHLTTQQAYLLLGGLLAVPYLTLVLPFSVVAVVMTLERLRSVEEHLGVTTDRQVRPVGTVMLLALPVVGGLILLGVMQRRLNQAWAAVAPAGLASR